MEIMRDHVPPLCSCLAVQELKDATLNIIWLVQFEVFPNVMAKLPNVSNRRLSSKLFLEASSCSILEFCQLIGLNP